MLFFYVDYILPCIFKSYYPICCFYVCTLGPNLVCSHATETTCYRCCEWVEYRHTHTHTHTHTCTPHKHTHARTHTHTTRTHARTHTHTHTVFMFLLSFQSPPPGCSVPPLSGARTSKRIRTSHSHSKCD